ncbi:MAG: hypothetical protein RhofKO_31930 [Rhodothermales bacterium]
MSIATNAGRYGLTLIGTPTGYAIVHDDPEVARLLGTATLPVPFTPAADMLEVLAEVKRLHPGRIVRLDPDLEARAASTTSTAEG